MILGASAQQTPRRDYTKEIMFIQNLTSQNTHVEGEGLHLTMSFGVSNGFMKASSRVSLNIQKLTQAFKSNFISFTKKKVYIRCNFMTIMQI